MHRILVPLDGSDLAISILPDARRLAGTGGTIILVREVAGHGYGVGTDAVDPADLDAAAQYLRLVAEYLTDLNVSVEIHTLALGRPAESIARAAEMFGADMIACATHARGSVGRLALGSVAWRTLACSPVPVLLRHPNGYPQPLSMFARPRHVMVPLDGSSYAERALPLATALADDWGAAIHLVSVIPSQPPRFGGPVDLSLLTSVDYARDLRQAQAYLDAVALRLPGDIRTHIRLGSVADRLIEAADDLLITDVVMASHGRTGLRRAALGSVADDLVHALHVPIIVVPAHTARVLASSTIREPVAAG